jgi:hypothetical protein
MSAGPNDYVRTSTITLNVGALGAIHLEIHLCSNRVGEFLHPSTFREHVGRNDVGVMGAGAETDGQVHIATCAPVL